MGWIKVCKPIKSRKKLNEIAEWFEEYKGEREALFWRFGINVGLRCVDILPMRYNDVYNSDGEFREYLIVRERKTGKEISIFLNDKVKMYLDRYVLDRPTLRKVNGHFFYSKWDPGRPVDYSLMWDYFKKAEYALGLQAFTPHSMRKTFGWHLFALTKDIRIVQKALNHVSPKTTMLYIEVDQIELDKSIRSLSLG